MTHINIPPEMSSEYAKVWRIDLQAFRAHKGLPADGSGDGGIAGWVIFCPNAATFWSYFSMSLIHLREIEGVEPPHIQLPGATHEVVVHALDPSYDATLPNVITGKDTLHWLTPVNFVGQFIAASDEAAHEMAVRALVQICAGKLTPEPPPLDGWIRLYGDHMVKKTGVDEATAMLEKSLGRTVH